MNKVYVSLHTDNDFTVEIGGEPVDQYDSFIFKSIAEAIRQLQSARITKALCYVNTSLNIFQMKTVDNPVHHWYYGCIRDAISSLKRGKDYSLDGNWILEVQIVRKNK